MFNFSTPSPHRTPPPQRQGVIIQRHNAGGSKPPSPAPQRLQVNQAHYTHHYSQGKLNFSWNLVDFPQENLENLLNKLFTNV